MIVEGFCKKCKRWYNAHWHRYPNEEIKRIFNPQCPYCKIEGHKNIRIENDESLTGDYHEKRNQSDCEAEGED